MKKVEMKEEEKNDSCRHNVDIMSDRREEKRREKKRREQKRIEKKNGVSSLRSLTPMRARVKNSLNLELYQEDDGRQGMANVFESRLCDGRRQLDPFARRFLTPFLLLY